MTRWSFLEELTNQMQLTQGELAKKLNWQQTRISDLFAGKANIPSRRVYDFACFFGLDFEQLKKYNDGQTDKIPSKADSVIKKRELIEIDIIDVRACCGNGIENFSENVVGQQLMTLPALKELTLTAPENIKIIKAIGESMMPTIHTDDVIWVDISVKTPTSDGLYLIAIGSDLLIRRIQINPFDNSAIVIADNLKYQPIPQKNYKDIKVIGRIIYHMQKTA